MPPHAGIFAVAWMNHARYLDPGDGYLHHSGEHPVPSHLISRARWSQFRLNQSNDDIELTLPPSPLQEKGYETGETLCSHPRLRSMNQSFVNPVPYNKDASEWVYMRHWGSDLGGTVCTPVRFRWNKETELYEWVETGPILSGMMGHGTGESAIAPYDDSWIIVSRLSTGKEGKHIYGNACYRTEDPFGKAPVPVFTPDTGSNCPITAYTFPDGTLRVLTTNQAKSPYQNIYRRRIPLHLMDIDPDRQFAVTRIEEVFDSLKEGLPIPSKHAPTIHFGRLISHSGGSKGWLSYFVRSRAISTRTHSIGNFKGIVGPEEIDASGVYYSELTYDLEYPARWEFR